MALDSVVTTKNNAIQRRTSNFRKSAQMATRQRTVSAEHIEDRPNDKSVTNCSSCYGAVFQLKRKEP